MIIRLAKGRGRPDSLTCIREDGSTTWTRLHPNMAAHDLAHLAVETVLGFQHAFYGMVARGTNITDFELPKAERPEMPTEAIQAEYIVGLLQTEPLNGKPYDDFPGALRAICKERSVEFPTFLTSKAADQIRTKWRTLLRQWYDLEEGERLEFRFEG